MTVEAPESSRRRVEPATVEELAEVLAQANRDRHRVAIRGGGTKSRLGVAPAAVDVLVSTKRLNAVLAHREGDLTATVQAGATLVEINRALARHRQWIPLDPPWSDRASIGGIVATNDSGPRRHRYGAPRDLIIGVDMVLAGGTAAKAGGIVVKNVAGYDLSRLMTGSFGSLAVITSATFKLYPIPAASRTVAISVPSSNALAERIAALANSQLTPTAIELQFPPSRLLVRFETIEAAAQEQAAAVEAIARQHGCDADTLAGDRESAAWDEHAGRPWNGEGAVIKVTMLPTSVATTLAWLEQTSGGREYDAIGRAAVSALLVRVGGDARHQAVVVNGLRERLPPGRGSAVVVRGSNELFSRVDAWGPIGDALPLMRAVKQRFDPNRILNPGVLGL